MLIAIIYLNVVICFLHVIIMILSYDIVLWLFLPISPTLIESKI